MILYYLFRAFEAFLTRLPQSWQRAIFIAIAHLAYHIDSKHRRVIKQNLRFAFGHDLTAEEEETISRYCYRNLMLSFYQAIENNHLSLEALQTRISIKNRHILDDALTKGRKIVFVSAHFGNWELGAAATARLLMPISAVYKAMNNPWFERYLLESRSRQGMQMVEKRGAVRHLTKALKSGRAVSLLIDQNTRERDGIEIKFFGKTARQSAAASFLARKYDALIIPLVLEEDATGHFTLCLKEPISVAQSDDSERDIAEATQKQADVIEAAIRENPKLWFWCHRRWKSEHPEIYKED